VEGLAAARALTTRAGASTSSWPGEAARTDQTYTFAIAGAEDDEEIRRLLRESVFAGDVRLSLEREPNSALAASIEGDVHDTIVARHRVSGEVAAIASRSVREVFLNGVPSRLGYLGQLRIDPRFRRHHGLLNAGFNFCRRLHSSRTGGEVSIYLASVVADNEPARRLLSRPVAGWPSFEPFDTLVTLAIPVRRSASRRPPAGVEICRGSEGFVNEIVACLQRNGSRSQFFPRWTRAALLSPTRSRGLDLSDFIVARRAGQVVGCVACWDQRAFKQAVVRGFSPLLARWRPLVNLVAPLSGSPRLPAVGAQLPYACVSHVAVDEDDDGVLMALLGEACVTARQKGLRYLAVGLSARSSLLARVRRSFGHRAYESVLYVAFWPEGEAVARSLDARPSYPELAIL
jgi:hypothetical protein